MKTFLLGFLCAGFFWLAGRPAVAQSWFRGKPTPLGVLTVNSMPDEGELKTAFIGTNRLASVGIKRVHRVQYDFLNTAGQPVESWTLYYPPAAAAAILGAATPPAYLDRAGQPVRLGGEPYATLLNAGYGRYDYNEDAPWIIDYEPDHLTFSARSFKAALPVGDRVGWFKSGSALPTFTVYFKPTLVYGEIRAVALAGNTTLNGTVIGPTVAAGAATPLTVTPVVPGTNMSGMDRSGTSEVEFIDRDGNPIPDTAVPFALRQPVMGVWAKNRLGVHPQPVALALGWVVLPAPETNRIFYPELAGAGWHRDRSYDLQPGRLHKLAEMAVCMELFENDLKSPCHVKISKLGYLSTELELPYSKAAGKVIWLGNISLQPGYPKDVCGVSGQLVSPDGGALAAEGVAHLSMVGMRESVDTRIDASRFAFPQVPPGNWVISFSLDRYSAKTSILRVEPGTKHIEQTFTAVPYYGLKLEIHTDSRPPWPLQVPAGGGHRDPTAGVLPHERLYFTQNGDEFKIRDSMYEVEVVKGPFQSLAAIKVSSAGLNNNVVLCVGDLIVLSNRKGGVVAAAEVVAMDALK